MEAERKKKFRLKSECAWAAVFESQQLAAPVGRSNLPSLVVAEAVVVTRFLSPLGLWVVANCSREPTVSVVVASVVPFFDVALMAGRNLARMRTPRRLPLPHLHECS